MRRRRSAVTVSSEIKLMPWLRTLPMRMFVHPKGVLGRLGDHGSHELGRRRASYRTARCSVGRQNPGGRVWARCRNSTAVAPRSRPHPSPGSKSRRKWCIKRWPATPTRCAAVNQRPRSGRDQYAHDATRHVVTHGIRRVLDSGGTFSRYPAAATAAEKRLDQGISEFASRQSARYDRGGRVLHGSERGLVL
jgi:hypothetical protein